MRQRLVLNVGGLLRYDPPEGVPASGTVSILSSVGVPLPTPVTDAAATPTETGLSFTVTAGNAATKGLYRAVWTYVVDEVTYVRDELYSVVSRILSPTARVPDLAPYLPTEMTRLVKASSEAQEILDEAWGQVLDDLESRGIQPDRVMDSDRLRIPHLFRTLAFWSAQKWGPRWADWSVAQQREYVDRLETVITGPDSWLDKNEDLRQQPEERPTISIKLSR